MEIEEGVRRAGRQPQAGHGRSLTSLSGHWHTWRSRPVPAARYRKALHSGDGTNQNRRLGIPGGPAGASCPVIGPNTAPWAAVGGAQSGREPQLVAQGHSSLPVRATTKETLAPNQVAHLLPVIHRSEWRLMGSHVLEHVSESSPAYQFPQQALLLHSLRYVSGTCCWFFYLSLYLLSRRPDWLL